ncbi:MAG: J domain-containing protein [Candidatus Acidiferrales bacterium]
MTTHKARPAKPEEQELEDKRKERTQLESDLADRELRLTNLHAELSAFERQYLRQVGLRYAELDELKALLAEKMVEHDPGQERLHRAAEQARSRAQESQAAAGAEGLKAPPTFTPTAEIRSVYREVARRVHPDLTSDRADRAKRQTLMAAANAAYKTGNVARLHTLLAEYEASPEAVKGEGAGADLVRVIRQISQARNRISEIEAEIEQIIRSDVFQLRVRCEEAQRAGRDLFQEMARRVEQQVAHLQARLQDQPVEVGS